MPLFRAVLLVSLLAASGFAQSVTTLVLRFQNNSRYTELNWVGESIAETLRSDFSQSNQIVLDRDDARNAMKKLDLRPEANLTKASVIHLAQTLEADVVVFGSYQVALPAGVTQLRESNITISAQTIDLRKMQSAPETSEAGKLSDLSRLEEHLAWESLAYLDPHHHTVFDQFIGSRKLTRLEAEESYIHGLLATDPEQQKKWFLQAANLDPNFVSPAFELGRFYLQHQDPKQATRWLTRIPASDQHYWEARFRLGIAAYQSGDYNTAVNLFREVSNTMPLHEVFNNLAAAEDQLNLPPAIDDFRRAVEADPTDVSYSFNLGAALLRRNLFDEAQQRLQSVVDQSPDDAEADRLLAQAEDKNITPPNSKPLAPARLKMSMDSTAFRQLKAMLQPKAK